jgi:hypothetical protein
MFSTPAILPLSLQLCQMATFQFSFQIGKRRRVGWVGRTVMIFFGQKFPRKKKKEVETVCVVMQQPVPLSPKFGAKSTHISRQSPRNVTVVCEIDCLACQNELFARKNP